MRQLLTEYLPIIIPVVSSIVTAAAGVVLAWLSASKAKAEAKEATSKLEIANAELELEKTTLETTIVEGTYTICPNCGSKISLKDIKFYVNNKEVHNG